MRSFLVPLLLLAAGCKTFGAETTETDAGADATEAPPPPSCPNGALRFDGKAFVKVEPNESALDSPSDLTVEAWILPDSQISDSEVHIVSHHDDANSDGWVLLLHKGLTFNVYSGSGKGNVATASDPDLVLGQWHHVAAVFDGSEKTITLFVDGITKGGNVRDKTMADPYSGTLAIGASASTSGNGFLGVIDEVRVSRKVRYPDTFTPVYPLPDDEDGTIGTWHFPSEKTVGEVANEARGRLASSLATFGGTAAGLPVPVVPACPPKARP